MSGELKPCGHHPDSGCTCRPPDPVAACPTCGNTDPVLRGGPSIGYGCYDEFHDSVASEADRVLAAQLRERDRGLSESWGNGPAHRYRCNRSCGVAVGEARGGVASYGF